MRGSKIPTYIGIGLVVSMAIYAWTVLGSAPQAVPGQTASPPTPTNTPAPWWYFATPMIATNTPVPTPTKEVEPDSFYTTPSITESCPALQTPTPPVINIVLPPVVVSTPLPTQMLVLPTITSTIEAGEALENIVEATITPTLVPTSTPTAAPTPTPSLPVITKIFGPVVAHGSVNTNVLRLRYGPSEKRDTVVFLFDGTLLDIYGKSPDGRWLGVRVAGTNLYGWVYARYVKIDRWETGGGK